MYLEELLSPVPHVLERFPSWRGDVPALEEHLALLQHLLWCGAAAPLPRQLFGRPIVVRLPVDPLQVAEVALADKFGGLRG